MKYESLCSKVVMLQRNFDCGSRCTQLHFLSRRILAQDEVSLINLLGYWTFQESSFQLKSVTIHCNFDIEQKCINILQCSRTDLLIQKTQNMDNIMFQWIKIRRDYPSKNSQYFQLFWPTQFPMLFLSDSSLLLGCFLCFFFCEF